MFLTKLLEQAAYVILPLFVSRVCRQVQRDPLQMSASSLFCLARSLWVPMMPAASGENVSFGLQPSTRLLLRRILAQLCACP